jgi:LysM repeat protein
MGILSSIVAAQTFVAPAVASTPSEIEATAKSYLGTPYVWGGQSPSGFDCSGYTQYVFKQLGIDLPRTAAQQFNVGTSVSKANLQKGDLVFFTTYKKGPSHVGIYLGNGKFINANSKGVSISSLNDSYWSSRYLGAKRVLSSTQQANTKHDVPHTHTHTKPNNNKPKTKIVQLSTVEPEKEPIKEPEKEPEKEPMKLNDDGKTYTVREGDTLSLIGANFNVSVEKLKLLNEKEDTLIRVGEKILVKGEPKLKVSLFEPVSDKEKPTTGEYSYLPEKDFELTDQQRLLFEQNPITRAELATALKYLAEHNPSSIHLLKEVDKDIEIKDVSEEHWAQKPIEWVVANGFMKLDNKGKFHPEEPVTVEDTNYIFDVFYKHYKLSDVDIEYIQKQMDKNEEWTYQYMQKLIYDISIELASNEEKQEEVSKGKVDQQEQAPSLAMAKKRMEQVTNLMLEQAANVSLINQNIKESIQE